MFCYFPHRLYEPQKKQPLVEKGSALRWCRQVLDNRSPEMEIACRLLMNKLDQSKDKNVFSNILTSKKVRLTVTVGLLCVPCVQDRGIRSLGVPQLSIMV